MSTIKLEDVQSEDILMYLADINKRKSFAKASRCLVELREVESEYFFKAPLLFLKVVIGLAIFTILFISLVSVGLLQFDWYDEFIIYFYHHQRDIFFGAMFITWLVGTLIFGARKQMKKFKILRENGFVSEQQVVDVIASMGKLLDGSVVKLSR